METHHTQFSPEKRHSDHFLIDDLLNFPTDDTDAYDVAGDMANAGSSTDSSVITTAFAESCNSSGEVARRFLTDAQFSHDLCVPYDDMAELEWLSSFVEDSFSTEDMEKLQLISGSVKPDPVGKARTKRSRAAPNNWSSRLAVLPQPSFGPTATISSESESDIGSSSIGKKTLPKKKEVYDSESHNGDGRKCLHCATDKTPQWRTGPLGPKNAL
ncbi:hypothetical protein R6Q59_026525 [Mikania micrantha]